MPVIKSIFGAMKTLVVFLADVSLLSLLSTSSFIYLRICNFTNYLVDFHWWGGKWWCYTLAITMTMLLSTFHSGKVKRLLDKSWGADSMLFMLSHNSEAATRILADHCFDAFLLFYDFPLAFVSSVLFLCHHRDYKYILRIATLPLNYIQKWTLSMRFLSHFWPRVRRTLIKMVGIPCFSLWKIYKVIKLLLLRKICLIP